ncbi:exodeoxyribonuclease VIII [Marinomonas piezotolerans]|uniref:Exodeoxyribonuclease VIII n=1 Tax=Marinomonas piezotolerans TaxID=2213058 RepID=A0A370UAI0_9GAMM|nr:exodeoxyribonuclease VIII [Marinomonas piezotolerans]
MQPDIYYDMSNHDYHRGAGISKSGLDWMEHNPSQLIWSQNAPRDQEALKALDFGTATHTMLLEPELFNQQFVVAPELNMRTNAGKAEWKEFVEANQDRTIMTFEEHRKLMIMRESVFAHPVARMIFEANGYNEASIFWEDEETGELCRIRPDRVINLDGQPVMVDVKKVAGLDRFERHVEEFRYHVQDAMYREGYKAHFGEDPLFWFLCVSDTVSAGKYEVEVVSLEPEWKDLGKEIFRENLNRYSYCRRENDWLHVREIKRPRWA